MSKRILICDDDEGIVDVTSIVLKESGYEIMSITDSENIYDAIEEFKPDLILLDLWMPILNGEEITKNLKSNRSTSGIPIIIVSASKDTEKTAYAIGADSFICKPFDIAELEETVKINLNKPQDE